MRMIDLSGVWQCSIPGQDKPITIPGTLDESGIGNPDTGANQWHPDAEANASVAHAGVIATRLTRRVTYEGPARLTWQLIWDVPADARVFFEVERARCLSLAVNGKPVPPTVQPTISTPQVFEVTGLLTGQDELTVTSDNSYPGLPHDAIVYSSAATDETQTNWNGLLGFVRLRIERSCFIQAVRVYPHGSQLDVCTVLSCASDWQGDLIVRSAALDTPACVAVEARPGVQEVWMCNLPLAASVRRWDEMEGILYELQVEGENLDPVSMSFGVRDFGSEAGHLTLNGRRIFLRSEANCAVFPETGHPPMRVDEWTKVLNTYRSYGVNCMRFHSHTPPEAAFEAADRLGMLMQPELSHWNPKTAFEDDASFAYYTAELRQILLRLANHPSFVMLTFGNELACGELGHERMNAMLTLAKELDGTRLYANASNAHYGNAGCDIESDFYASQSWFDHSIRATSCNMTGYLNQQYPSADVDYEPGMAAIRSAYDKPVFTFEVGQYEVLPDFDELEDFRGVTRPDNLALIRDRVREHGFAEGWKRRVEATGELSLLCYREEAEAALRTGSLSGISLLGLQDFPGQGTALVGMLNSHLQAKPFPFAQPERFHAFFAGQLPLALLPRYTYEAGETLTVPVRFANYGKTDLNGALIYELSDGMTAATGFLPPVCAAQGGLTDLGTIRISLAGFSTPKRLELHLWFGGCENSYPVWVYPATKPICPVNVHEARTLDDAALSVLNAGGTVYLSPDSTAEALPTSIKAQFSTDFWSVGTFGGQTGAMGQLIDTSHPIFTQFPTEFHTNWQWWPMATQRAIVLPENIPAIVTELDCYAYLRPMAQLFECRCGGGRLLVSSFGLQHLQQYPEARALQAAIYAYLASGSYVSTSELSVDLIRRIVR